MPDILKGKVIEVLSGPNRRTSKTITIVKEWVDGIYKGETEKEPFAREWFEVIAIVDEEYCDRYSRTFEFPSLEQAARIVPGYTYSC